MKSLERFLNSGWYIMLVFGFTFLSWTFYQDSPPHEFNVYNMAGVFFLILVFGVVIALYQNTLYTIPLLMSFLFVISKTDMTFETVAQMGFPYIAFFIFLLGPVIHIIRFRPKPKFGRLMIGLVLIAVAYLVPLTYLPFDVRAIPVSIMGVLYVLVYLFLSSTTKGNLDYLFKIMIFANLLFTAQVFVYVYRGMQLFPDQDLYRRLLQGWNRNLGWANINDMCFYIALTFPAYVYFIFKKPQSWLYWALMLLPVTAVILSTSRGGAISFSIAFLGSLFLIAVRGRKPQLLRGLVVFGVAAVFFALNYGMFELWWEIYFDSFGDDLNAFSSGRIAIYKLGLDVFREYPLFGGGWLSLQLLRPGARLFAYHSSVIQALAAMGLFGLVALLVHYFQVFSYMFEKVSLEKSLFLIGYVASQVHGLIDNVQFDLPYSVLIVIFFAVWETAERKTSFELSSRCYLAC
ncbi:MAG: O-antigen ligase domain-containing protein [Acholeplasmataceae bacterium]|nr:MAG: O-antigen ligase domain-containing protein [Acholeplasmataceae bacterium]